MFRSSRRNTVKNSIPRRPRFAPRLETLESRFAPACTYYPASQALVGTGNDTALFYYVPASGGVDIYCNGQYAGTNLGGTTTYYAGPNSKMEIDATLDSNGSDNWLWDYWAYFGHWINFDQSNITDVAFILGSGSNVVNITGPSYYLTGNLPTATVVGWGPTSVIVEDSAATSSEVLAVTPSKIYSAFDTLANLYSVGYVELRTGSGNDQFFVGNPGNSLGTMPLTYVKGGTGTDSLTLEAYDTTGERYYLTENGVHMANWGKDVLYYQSIENTILNASSGNDETHIVSNSGTLNGVPPITVNGGAGTDSVTYYDTNASHGNAYTMTSTSLIAWSQATFGYSAVEALTLHAASGSNTISINSTPAGSTTTVKAGGGHDTISVATISGLYSDIGGPLTIDGGAGTDTLTLYDNNSVYTGSQGEYSISATAVAITGLHTTSYAAMEGLTLNDGERHQIVNILSTHAGGPTVINSDGETMPHNYSVCPTTRSLDSLGGPLTINDSSIYWHNITVHDDLSASNGSYAMTSTSVTRTGAQSVNYDDAMHAVFVNTAFGNNTINVESSKASYLGIHSGGGHDTLVVGGTIGVVSGWQTAIGFDGQDIVINNVNSAPSETYKVHFSVPSAPVVVELPIGVVVYGEATTESVAIYDGSGNANVSVWSYDSLGAMPPVTINGGGGTDDLTLEVFDATDEKYHFTELGVHMANWGKDVLYYPGVENVTLKAGTGNDEITVGSNSNKLEYLPIITGNGGAGNDAMILNNSGWVDNGKVYDLTDLGLSVGVWPPDEFIFYVAVENVTLKTGSGYDGVYVGGDKYTLSGIPDLTLENGGPGNDILMFRNGNSAIDETYVLTENQFRMPKTLGLVASFTNFGAVFVASGAGADILNIAPESGSLLTMPNTIGFYGDDFGTSTDDTVNMFDHNYLNAQTYVVDSSSAGHGTLQASASGVVIAFTDVAKANLFPNVKKNWTLDTSEYNPEHYKLNIYYRVTSIPTGRSSVDPDTVNRPPVPAPPAPPIDEAQILTTLAKPSPATHARRDGTVQIDSLRPSVTDEIFESPLLSVDGQ